MEVACSSWVWWAAADSASWAKAGSMTARKRPSMAVYTRMLLPQDVADHSMQTSSNSSRPVGIFSDEAPSFFLHLPDIAQWVVDLIFHLFYRFNTWQWRTGSSGGSADIGCGGRSNGAGVHSCTADSEGDGGARLICGQSPVFFKQSPFLALSEVAAYLYTHYYHHHNYQIYYYYC